jgi:hypothetical protein
VGLSPRTSRGARAWFVALAIVAIVLTVHGVIAEKPRHVSLGQWLATRKLLSVNEGLALLVALVAVIIAHRQFVLNTRPYLHWTTVESDFAARIWRATLKNHGAGLAVIRAARYSVIFPGEAERAGTYEEILGALDKHGVAIGPGFMLVRFTRGSVLGPGGEIRMMEMSFDDAKRIRALDVDLEYDGVLGDAFRMRVALIPRRGIAAD